jgi:hypothetical protein
MTAAILPAVIMPSGMSPDDVHRHGAHGGQFSLHREREHPARLRTSNTGGPDISLPMIGGKSRTV